jgi:hypothetical protein
MLSSIKFVDKEATERALKEAEKANKREKKRLKKVLLGYMHISMTASLARLNAVTCSRYYNSTE